MPGAASAVGELRRAIRAFLSEAGDSPLAGELRNLDVKLADAGKAPAEQTPGQRAAGVEKSSRGGDDSGGTPGGRAASTPAREDNNSAKGSSNLPPFMQRQMKRRATARGGS